jgi:hypothetical protein
VRVVQDRAELVERSRQEGERTLGAQFEALQLAAGAVDLGRHGERRGAAVLPLVSRLSGSPVSDQGMTSAVCLDVGLDVLLEEARRQQGFLVRIPFEAEVQVVGQHRVQVGIAARQGLVGLADGGVARRQVLQLRTRHHLGGREADEEVLERLGRDVQGRQGVGVLARRRLDASVGTARMTVPNGVTVTGRGAAGLL